MHFPSLLFAAISTTVFFNFVGDDDDIQFHLSSCIHCSLELGHSRVAFYLFSWSSFLENDHEQVDQKNSRGSSIKTVFSKGIIGKMKRFRAWYSENFSVTGRYFKTRCVAFEIAEIVVQQASLASSFQKLHIRTCCLFCLSYFSILLLHHASSTWEIGIIFSSRTSPLILHIASQWVSHRTRRPRSFFHNITSILLPMSSTTDSLKFRTICHRRKIMKKRSAPRTRTPAEKFRNRALRNVAGVITSLQSFGRRGV